MAASSLMRQKSVNLDGLPGFSSCIQTWEVRNILAFRFSRNLFTLSSEWLYSKVIRERMDISLELWVCHLHGVISFVCDGMEILATASARKQELVTILLSFFLLPCSLSAPLTAPGCLDLN